MMSKRINSRRRAIKQIAGGATLLATSGILAGTTRRPEGKLGVALVGLGNYATRQLGPALRETQYCALRGIVTGTPAKAKEWQAEYHLAPAHTYNYEHFDQLADDPTIDIVYIVLPNFMHAEYTIRALAAGKHVICEKPMGMNAGECEQMIRAAQQHNRLLQIGYRLFYEPHHLALQQAAQQAPTGGIRMIEASLGFNMARPGMWRIDKAKGGGGALMDLGPYTIQAARRAVGQNPVSVSAQGYKDDPVLYKDIYGTYAWQLHFADGTVCNSTTSFSAYVDRFYVARSNDYLALEPAYAANADLALRTRAGVEQLSTPNYQQASQMDAFALNIKDQTPVVASGQEGLIDLQIIDAIKQSLEQGGATIEIAY